MIYMKYLVLIPLGLFNLTLKALSQTVADDIPTFFMTILYRVARQTIHMKCQALFALEKYTQKYQIIVCCSCDLRMVKQYFIQITYTKYNNDCKIRQMAPG